MATLQEFTLCEHINTWAPLNVWTPLALRSVHTDTRGHTCPSKVLLKLQCDPSPPAIRHCGAQGSSPALPTGPQALTCLVSVLQTDFEKDVDLACRSGERLTGESDRWPSPGPTSFSFFVYLFIHLSSSYPCLPQPTQTKEMLPWEPWPEQADMGPPQGLGLTQTLVCTSAPMPPSPTFSPEAAGSLWGRGHLCW